MLIFKLCKPMRNVYFTARQNVYIFLMLKINHSPLMLYRDGRNRKKENKKRKKWTQRQNNVITL